MDAKFISKRPIALKGTPDTEYRHSLRGYFRSVDSFTEIKASGEVRALFAPGYFGNLHRGEGVQLRDVISDKRL